MWLGYRISFGLLGLAALSGLLACSGQGANASPNEGGSYGTAGIASASAASAASGAGGHETGGSLGSGGNAGGAASASASAAGAFGQGGFTSNAAAGGANSGPPSTGFGGLSGASAAGSAGAVPNSGGAGSSGVGNVAGSGGGSAAFAQVSAILGKNCGIKGCHADKQSPHFVPDAMLYATLTGPNTVLAACDYTRLVEAGDPAKSALVRLMNRTCGSFTMPPSCNKTPCLAAADLKALSDWISAGAPP
jgi:hypothetical protein